MYIHTDDVGKVIKGAHKAGMSAGNLAGNFTGAQRAMVAAKDAAPKLMSAGFSQGARAMFGPAALAGGAAMHVMGKGYDKAKTNPGFYKGKAGKSYLDLSTNTSGKYGIDY